MTDTCHHLYDNGGACNAAAVRGRDFCASHLRFRARQLRQAQIRARNQRFDLKLPLLESMPTVVSALNHLVEAVAADMLDLKRADFLLKSLRFAAQALKNSDKWPAGSFTHPAETTSVDTPCAGAQSEGAPPSSSPFGDTAASIDLAAEYGLPNDIDVSTPPEVAFPEPAMGGPQLPDVGNCGNAAEATDDSNDHFVAALRNEGILSDMEFRPDYPVTPEYVELHEIRRNLGSEASLARSTQMMSNERRRRLRTERKRYAKIAAQINLQRAADKLAELKLAERAAQQTLPAQSTVGCPVQGREAALNGGFTDATAECLTQTGVAGPGPHPTDASAAKKPPLSAVDSATPSTDATRKEHKSIA